MREILFRGKRIDNGKWEYGGCVSTENEVFLIYNQTHSIDLEPHAVEKRTIGQYTGLTDRNDKKIFEGDIVKGFYKPTDKLVCGSVKYENHLARMLIINRGVCAGLSHCHHVEVIGNIYDNKDLIGESV